jgi:hypothetical protein
MIRLAGLIPVAALVFTVACGQTDAGITTSVKSRLAADDSVRALDINVDTRDHVVTLTGTVGSFTAKEQALKLARETDGVREVVDRIEIGETAATSGVGDAARKIGEGAREGAEAVGDAAKDGAKAVGEGAKRVGSDVRDAVTDKDRDSDKDGK